MIAAPAICVVINQETVFMTITTLPVFGVMEIPIYVHMDAVNQTIVVILIPVTITQRKNCLKLRWHL